MIYKLKYKSESEAISDLLSKGVLVNSTDLQGNKVTAYTEDTKAVVYIGRIVDTPAVIENQQIVTEATFLDGYHVDVMTDLEIKFDNEIFPNNPKHRFA